MHTSIQVVSERRIAAYATRPAMAVQRAAAGAAPDSARPPAPAAAGSRAARTSAASAASDAARSHVRPLIVVAPASRAADSLPCAGAAVTLERDALAHERISSEVILSPSTAERNIALMGLPGNLPVSPLLRMVLPSI